MTLSHKIILGDCVAGMQTLPDGCVQTCITSPPYWGLRDYQGGTEEIGQEETVEGYVEKMVEVFREIKRILRDDGTVWLNLGDSYMSARGCAPPPQTFANGNADGQPKDFVPPNRRDQKGLKNKDMIGIPWRVAFALQADGWYLRQDIVWHKPNPMPESVEDRCTKAHEYIFLLSKSPHYYYDHVAIKEDAVGVPHSPGNKNVTQPKEKGARDPALDPDRVWALDGKKNKRSVWTVNTKGYKGAHFAVYPEKLIEPCILAGTSEHGCCSKCGTPYERQVKHRRISRTELEPSDPRYRPNKYKGEYEEINGKGDAGYCSSETIGWEASCKCEDASIVPCVVFDPFTGSGTTAVVALKNNRKYIGTELNPDYVKIAEERIKEEIKPNLTDVFE